MQEDVTGYTASRIARKVRCETREAVKNLLGVYLTTLQDDPRAMALGQRLLADAPAIASEDLKPLGRHAREIIAFYADTAVAYDFSFDGTETDNIGGTLDAVRAFDTGARSLGLAAANDRSRQNIQTFTLADTFIGLLGKVGQDYCVEKNAEKNYLYPIVGKIGIARMLRDFIELDQYAGLVSPDKANPIGPPTMVSNLTFQTRISASATPAINLLPVVGKTRVSGSLAGNFSRVDTHKLIIAFARPVKTSIDAQALRSFSGEIITPAGTQSEQLAQLAIQQSIIRFDLKDSRPTLVVQSLLPF